MPSRRSHTAVRRIVAIAALAGAALVAATAPSAAELLPPLRDDFVVEGTVFGDQDSLPMTLRHRAGMVRTDIVTSGQTVVSLLELATRKATGIVTVGGRTMVMEMRLDGLPGGNHLCVAEGMRVGSSTVLGEACDEYETVEQDVAHRGRVCVTRDGIPLRTVEVATGRTVWLAARVSRAPQEAALFQVPPDAMRLPAGAGAKPLNTR